MRTYRSNPPISGRPGPRGRGGERSISVHSPRRHRHGQYARRPRRGAARAVGVPAAAPGRPARPGAAAAAAPRRRAALGWLVVLVAGLAELLLGGYHLGRARCGGTRATPGKWRSARPGRSWPCCGIRTPSTASTTSACTRSWTSWAPRPPSCGCRPLVAERPGRRLTAALGRRLAAGAPRQPAPRLTGLLAGLLLAGLPLTTWYAQDARPYAAATLLRRPATYLLVRGITEGRGRWWWAGYGAAVPHPGPAQPGGPAAGRAHGGSLLILRLPRRPGGGARRGPPAGAGWPRCWPPRGAQPAAGSTRPGRTASSTRWPAPPST